MQHVSLLALVYVPHMRLGPSCLVRIILHLRYACLCSLLCCLHSYTGRACAAWHLSPCLQHCICAMLVCAASVVARISVCATHAAGPFLPCLHHIAFAPCLLMHLALLFALVYVPCMSGLAPLALSAALHLRYACGCSMCHCSH